MVDWLYMNSYNTVSVMVLLWDNGAPHAYKIILAREKNHGAHRFLLTDTCVVLLSLIPMQFVGETAL